MGVTAAPGVIVHEEDGEAFLLHVATGRYFGLNRTGLAVWQALVVGADPLDEVRRRWPTVSAGVARSDVDALLEALIVAGLAQDGHGGGQETPASAP